MTLFIQFFLFIFILFEDPELVIVIFVKGI